MALKFFGIGSAQIPDRVGETTDIANMNTDYLRMLTDEHSLEGKEGKTGTWNLIGAITNHKKIMKPEDAENPRQVKCWEHVKAPFLYVEGTTIDEHPNAQAAEALVKFCHANPNLPLKVGLSIEGLILQRGSEDKSDPAYKQLKKTIAEGVALTVKPCNPYCFLQPYHDLTKSEMDEVSLPKEVIESLLASPDRKASFINRPELTIKRKIDNLRKSLSDVTKGGTTAMKCWSCGETEKMFKTSISNRCKKCGSARSMDEIWKALNE